MNIEKLKEKYNLNEFSTGGNCTALGTDLNTRYGQILITDSDCNAPTDNDKEFTLGVIFDNEDEPDRIHTFETTNIDHLDELLDAVSTLWGN